MERSRDCAQRHTEAIGHPETRSDNAEQQKRAHHGYRKFTMPA
jgi:hypothetical protein